MRPREFDESIINPASEVSMGACLPDVASAETAIEGNQSTDSPGVLRTDRLIIVDGSMYTGIDLGIVGRCYLEYVFRDLDESKVVAVESPQELTKVLRSFSSIDHLFILAHSAAGETALKIGKGQLPILELANALSSSSMPTIGAISVDGCKLGGNLDGLLALAQSTGGSFVEGWPLSVGFSVVSATGLESTSDEELEVLIAENRDYLIGPPSFEDVRRTGLLALEWLQVEETLPEGFPTGPPPAEFDGSLSDLRASMGYFRRSGAPAVMIPRSFRVGSEESADVMARIAVDYSDLVAWDVTMGTDPYEHVFKVYVY